MKHIFESAPRVLTFVRAALALALVAPLALGAAKPVTRPSAYIFAHDWLATANRTAEGAIVIGNPAAKVKVVEYLSLTCPHCAVLAGEAMKPLQQNYIAKGLVSFEVRHAVRDGYDFAASLLARCQPAAGYLPTIDALFAGQQGWMDKGMAAANDPGFDAKSSDEKLVFVAHAAGFDSFFAARGMSAERYAACIGDSAAKMQLAKMAGNAWERDAIKGTPAVLINGKTEPVTTWADLDTKLKAALK